MSLDRIFTAQRGTSFYFPQLKYWLIPVLTRLRPFEIKVLVITRAYRLIASLFPDVVCLSPDQVVPKDKYNYIFSLDTCYPFTPNSVVITNLPSADGITFNLPVPRRSTFESSNEDLLRSVARFSYINPDKKLLVMVSSDRQADSFITNLARANIQSGKIGSSNKIIIGGREACLLMANQLTFDCVFDSMRVNAITLTWSGGKRYHDRPVTQQEADEANYFGGIVVRFGSIGPEDDQCLWWKWLRDESLTPPPISRCWNEEGISREVKDFLTQVWLGPRPALLVWQWVKAGNPVYPCALLASLIDCYDASYQFNSVQNLLYTWQRLGLDKKNEVDDSVNRILKYFQPEKTAFEIDKFITQVGPYLEKVYQDRKVKQLVKDQGIYDHGVLAYFPDKYPAEGLALVTHPEKDKCLIWLLWSLDQEKEEVINEITIINTPQQL